MASSQPQPPGPHCIFFVLLYQIRWPIQIVLSHPLWSKVRDSKIAVQGLIMTAGLFDLPYELRQYIFREVVTYSCRLRPPHATDASTNIVNIFCVSKSIFAETHHLFYSLNCFDLTGLPRKELDLLLEQIGPRNRAALQRVRYANRSPDDAWDIHPRITENESIRNYAVINDACPNLKTLIIYKPRERQYEQQLFRFITKSLWSGDERCSPEIVVEWMSDLAKWQMPKLESLGLTKEVLSPERASARRHRINEPKIERFASYERGGIHW